jgi:hypothetical protein
VCKCAQREEVCESERVHRECSVCASVYRERKCVRVKECRFERVSECKSETLGFLGLYWVELSVCIIPPIIYNLLPPRTYPVLGNHVNLLVCVFICVCFRSSMHNKLVSKH